jgi:hypothetical protein
VSAQPAFFPTGQESEAEALLRHPDVVATIRALHEQYVSRGAKGSWGIRFHYNNTGELLVVEWETSSVKQDVRGLTPKCKVP